MLNILDEVSGCRTIAIGAHIRPDGDAVGSCMAMALYLEKAIPDGRVDVFLEECEESLMRNIEGSEQIRHDAVTDIDRYDAFICLDCNAPRLGKAYPIFQKAAKTINIDHHETNPGTGDVCWVVPKASSACELVYQTMDEARIDQRIAKNLYIGMVTDTGVFAYSNTSRQTLEIAGKLIEYGFDFPSVVREVFYEKTYLQQQMMGFALRESELLLDGRVLATHITRETMLAHGAGSKDMEGIASQLVHTYGVVCAIFMYEIEPGRYKVSLRSTGEVNVAEVAAATPGGGGHARAAGTTVDAPYEEIVGFMTPLIKEQLDQGVWVK